jgi:hypothetical protein
MSSCATTGSWLPLANFVLLLLSSGEDARQREIVFVQQGDKSFSAAAGTCTFCIFLLCTIFPG